MAIINFSTSPDRGVAGTVTLDKTELAAVSSVAGDAYYSDSSNWETVILYYGSNESDQKELVNFDASESIPSAEFLVSEKSRGDFLIQSIIIKDFDGGIFQVFRSELNTAEFDVILSVLYDVSIFNSNADSNFTSSEEATNLDYTNSIDFLSDNTIIYANRNITDFGGFTGANNVVKINTDGTALNLGYHADTNNIAINPNNDEIYKAGNSNISRADSNGNALTFNSGFFGAGDKTIAIDSLNNVYIGSPFTNFGGVTGQDLILKKSADGTNDATFNSNVLGFFTAGNAVGIHDIYIDGSDNIYVAGDFTYDNTVDTAYNNFVVLNSDGTLNSTLSNGFNSGGNRFIGRVEGIKSDSSGNIYLIGDSPNIDGNSNVDRLVKLTSSGALDSSWATNFSLPSNFQHQGFDVSPEGVVYVGLIGSVSNDVGGVVGRKGIFSYNTDGTVNETFLQNQIDGNITAPSVIVVRHVAYRENTLFVGLQNSTTVNGFDSFVAISTD